MHKWNTQVDDDAHDIDVLIPMYNLIEYSDIYSKTSGSLCQRWTVNITENINDFPNNSNNNNSIWFKFKQKITQKQEAVAQKMLKQWNH